jgi:O-antigen ligase
MLMILFVTVMCSTERSAKRLFRVGCDVYILLMLLNTVFTLFPQLYHLFTDWEPDFFISADNLTGFPLLFGALLALLDRHFNKNRVRCVIYLVLFFINQVLIHCASAMIAGAILAVYLLLPQAKALAERKPLTLFVWLSVLLCAVLCAGTWVYFHTPIGPRLMDNMLDVLKSLYIRFIIWNGVLSIIAKKPFLGYGLGDRAEFFLRPKTSLSYNAHNAYLQTIYEGGLVTTCSALAVFIFTSGILKKCSDRKLAGLFTTVIFAELIMMQSSITSWFTWYPVFLIAQIGALICTLPDEGEKS